MSPRIVAGLRVSATDCFLASSSDSFEIFGIRTVGSDRVIDAVAEDVSEDGVIGRSVSSLHLRNWEVFVVWCPVRHRLVDRFEVASST